MTFLVDAQLPPALVARLQQRGHVAAHVDAVGLRMRTGLRPSVNPC